MGNFVNYIIKKVSANFNEDLGEKVDVLLRDAIEVVNIKMDVNPKEKRCHVRFVPREKVAEKYEQSGQEVKDTMWTDYFHAKEIRVPISEDIDEEVTKFINSGDVEVLDVLYISCSNYDSALVFYASRAEVTKKEEKVKAENQAKIEERAKKLAESAVKDPKMLEETESVIDKYESALEDKKEAIENTENEHKKEEEVIAKKVTKNTKKGNK